MPSRAAAVTQGARARGRAAAQACGGGRRAAARWGSPAGGAGREARAAARGGAAAAARAGAAAGGQRCGRVRASGGSGARPPAAPPRWRFAAAVSRGLAKSGVTKRCSLPSCPAERQKAGLSCRGSCESGSGHSLCGCYCSCPRH